jgi:hypothetical protein
MSLRAVWASVIAGALGSMLAAPAWPAMALLFFKIIGEIVMSGR